MIWEESEVPLKVELPDDSRAGWRVYIPEMPRYGVGFGVNHPPKGVVLVIAERFDEQGAAIGRIDCEIDYQIDGATRCYSLLFLWALFARGVRVESNRPTDRDASRGDWPS